MHPAANDVYLRFSDPDLFQDTFGLSPDWPLANAESPVPLPYKTSQVSHNHCTMLRTQISVRALTADDVANFQSSADELLL